MKCFCPEGGKILETLVNIMESRTTVMVKHHCNIVLDHIGVPNKVMPV